MLRTILKLINSAVPLSLRDISEELNMDGELIKGGLKILEMKGYIHIKKYRQYAMNKGCFHCGLSNACNVSSKNDPIIYALTQKGKSLIKN
ncbi:MAG: hypothetical protein ACTSRA_09460 [Promethearchaeota archaeon]